MSGNARLANAAATAAADGILSLLNSGVLRIYDGVQPADANTAVTTQNLLAQLTFGSTAFGTVTNGLATANAISSGSAGATGTATWFRALKSDGTTPVFDGSAGVSNTDLILDSASIVSGDAVGVSSFTYQQPE